MWKFDENFKNLLDFFSDVWYNEISGLGIRRRPVELVKPNWWKFCVNFLSLVPLNFCPGFSNTKPPGAVSID